jgi:membrane associated rhomboid family serine protease
VDGDGDFDVEDVAKYLHRKKKQINTDIKADWAADQNGDGRIDVSDVLESKVQGTSVEDETSKGLKAHPPFFMIFQVFACLGLWVFFACYNQQYLTGGLNQAGTVADRCSDGSCSSNYMWTNNEKNFAECKAECNKYDACRGIAYRDSVPSTCILLSTVTTAFGTDSEFRQVIKASFSVTRALTALAGLDSIWPGQTTLRLNGNRCEDYGYEVWRWFTYQFTHSGTSHVVMNQVMNLLLGIPIEGLHGTRRAILMYNTGVLGGALCYILGDGHRSVVGCSGGCYALLGLHFGGLLLNWHQTKYRKPVLFMLFMITLIELVSYYGLHSGEETSHTAHVGGAIAGLLICVLVGKNTVVTTKDRVYQVIAVLLGGGILIWAFSWWLTNPFPASRNIFANLETDSEPWCWQGQYWEGPAAGWQCIRCQTESCVAAWYSEYPNRVAQANNQLCSTLPFRDEWK